MSYTKVDFPVTSEAALMAVSADGTVLITGDYGGVRVWSLETMDQLRTISSAEMYLNAAALSPDGHHLALGDGTGNKITVWDTRTGHLLRTLVGHTDWPLALAFSPDGQTLVSGGRDARGIVWDAHTGRRLKTVQGHRMPVTTVAVSPASTQFATGSSDGLAVVWDISSGRQMLSHDTSPLTVSKLAFAPAQPYLVVVCEDIHTSYGEESQMTGYAEARTVNLRTGLTLGATPTIATRITAVCFIAPDTYLLGDWDGNVSTVDLESGATIDEFRADEESYLVNELAWIPQKSTLLVADLNGVTALQSGKVQISHSKSSNDSMMPLQSHDGEVYSIAIMPGGSKLFSYGRDRKIIEYDLERDEVDGYVYATEGYPHGFALDQNGEKVYVLGTENDISHLTVLDARDISVGLASQHFETPSSRLRLSGDGQLVAIGETGKVALYTQDSALLPVATIELPREDGGFAARPHDIAFNSIGSQLLIATGTTNPRLLIYNIARRKFIAEWNAKNLVNLGSWFNTGVWLDDHQIAVGDGRGQIHILDTQTGKNLLTLDGHTSTVSSLQPLPRGMLLSGGFDRTARMWNLTAGKEVQRWTLNDTVITLAASIGPSRRLFAGDGSGQVIELIEPS